MAAVELSNVFSEKVREFRQKDDSERFMEDFQTAAQYILKEMSVWGNESSELEDASGIDVTITSLDDKYQYVLSQGISYRLIMLGQKPRTGNTLEMAREMWEDARGDYAADLIQQLQKTATNDIVGLGAVGSNDSVDIA